MIPWKRLAVFEISLSMTVRKECRRKVRSILKKAFAFVMPLFSILIFSLSWFICLYCSICTHAWRSCFQLAWIKPQKPATWCGEVLFLVWIRGKCKLPKIYLSISIEREVWVGTPVSIPHSSLSLMVAVALWTTSMLEVPRLGIAVPTAD